jgi:hypothetical protein
VTKNRIFEKAALCVTLCAMTIGCAACGEKKPAAVGEDGGRHLLSKGRTCQPGTPERYEIEVTASSQVLKDPDDESIVVCKGDKLLWSIVSTNAVITITFKDSYADQIFGPGKSKFSSNSGNPKSATDEHVVIWNGPKAKLFKYSIDVFDPGTGTGTHYPLDPHVIPMGNGGS